ncbi:MAG: hypothetical protein JJ975_14960 [Bacteroidia bacterium]|nr:hypothetical protein [Bacteroidia bacterium]
MDRKKFLTTATLTAFSYSIFGCVKPVGDRFEGSCETSKDILGPFYRPDAPFRSDLTSSKNANPIINIVGAVYQDDCQTPIPEALVEIWHCDGAGGYDNTSDEYRYRASWETNDEGQYVFKTQMPGKYLNGKLYRPAHIHFRVSAKGHNELISQLYFQGDPHITNDPWASSPNAVHRIVPIIPVGTGGELTVEFNIYLKGN